MRNTKHLIRIAAAAWAVILLSGCVIEPAWGPYHHPHYWGY